MLELKQGMKENACLQICWEKWSQIWSQDDQKPEMLRLFQAIGISGKKLTLKRKPYHVKRGQLVLLLWLLEWTNTPQIQILKIYFITTQNFPKLVLSSDPDFDWTMSADHAYCEQRWLCNC